MPRIPSSAGYFFDFRELKTQWGLQSIQVPSRPIGRLFRENSAFLEILTGTLGTITCAGRGWGNLQACHRRARTFGIQPPSGSYSRKVALSDHMHRYAGKTLVSEKQGDKYDRKCTFLYRKGMPRVPSSAGYFFDFRELETQWVLQSIQVPSRPIGRLFRENSGFSEILTRTLGIITCAGRGWGNLQACHRRARTFGSQPPSGSYSRRVALTDHMHRYAGKTLVSEKQGDKYDRKCTFPYRKGMPRVPSSAGYFFDFRELEAQWVLQSIQVPSRPIGRLFREKSGFSEILTRTLGTITCAGRGWGNLQACHRRARTFGSQPPSGSYSRRVALSDHTHRYAGKTLVSEKYGDKYDRKCTFLYRKGMPRVPSSAGYFFDFRELGTQWVLQSIQVPSRPIGRLFRENSGFSEILTRTLGTITCVGRGWGNLQACHRRARTFGSQPPSGSYSRMLALSDHAHRYAGKTLVSEKQGDKYDRKCTFPYRKGMPRIPSSAGYFFDFRELETQWVLQTKQVPSRPIGRLFRENSGFSEILTRTLGTITYAGRGWGNLQACHRRARTFESQPPSGSYSRRVALSDHMHRYAGKTLVSEKQGDKYDRKCTFPYRKGIPRVPSSAGYFFDYRELETQWVLQSIQVPSRPIGRLFRVNSGFSEILTRTLGTITCVGRGWGNLQACHRRARTFGSQPPSGSYSRRMALSDHMHHYAGKTLVSEKQGDKYDGKCTFPYRKGMPRVPSSAGYFFDFRELETQWVLQSIQVPSRPIGRLFRENYGFSEILTRTLGTITCAGRGEVICRPVIAERGLSGASHLVGLTVEGWHSQTTRTAMPGKLWFPRNRGANMTENAHFRIEKACRGYPLRLGTFSTFGSWRPSGFPRNRGTNMTENAHFRIEKAYRGYPLRLGTFSTIGSWRPSGFCSPYKCLHGPQVGYSGKTLVSRKF